MAFGSARISISTEELAANASLIAAAMSSARSRRMPFMPHASAIAAWSTGSKSQAFVCRPRPASSACDYDFDFMTSCGLQF